MRGVLSSFPDTAADLRPGDVFTVKNEWTPREHHTAVKIRRDSGRLWITYPDRQEHLYQPDEKIAIIGHVS
jgi:hypothetical protein